MLRDEEGNLTIEASLLLPIILGITMLLLFFALYSYQKSMLLQIGEAAAERAAYNWDNSHKEAASGTYAKGEYDSLYWRLSSDGLLTSLFGTESANGGISISLPSETSEGSLPAVKLERSSVMIPDNLSGEMSYTYTLTGRKTGATLQRVLDLPVLDRILEDGAKPVVSVQSVVTEPVEFIRTVELVRYYGAKFKGLKANGETGEAIKQDEASSIVSKLK